VAVLLARQPDATPGCRQMARLLKNSTQNQLMTFLRRVKKLINKVQVGDAVLLPAIVEGEELLLLLARTSERYFDVVRHSSNASHHGIDMASGSRLLR
jgi:hypothetical protein